MIRLFIQKHMAVFSLSVLIVIVGVIAYVTIPRESSPEIKQPYIFITTTWAGVSATEIETLVTQPIEKELESMNGLADLTSESRPCFGLAHVSDIALPSRRYRGDRRCGKDRS
jgi:multidrug efflux pump